MYLYGTILFWCIFFYSFKSTLMSTINRNRECVNQSVHFTEENRQKPYEVLEDFYSCFHLQDLREMLWDWLVAAMRTESGQYDTGYARSNLIFVYEKLELLLEATYTINKRRRKRLQRNRRKWTTKR